MREAGRAARILQISDVVRLRFRKIAGGAVERGQALPVAGSDSTLRRGGFGQFGQLGREQQKPGVAAVELDAELLDIGVAAAEAGREGERDRPRAGIDRSEEAGGELRAG